MIKYLRLLIASVALSGYGQEAFANFSFAPSGTTTMLAVDAANQGTSLCAAASTECAASVPINTAGSPLFVVANPGAVVLNAETTKVIGTVNQGTSPWVVSNGGTFAVQASAGTNLNTSLLALEAGGNLAQTVTDLGAPGATACATDTASCSLNQLAQRLAQRLTTINTTLGTPLQAGGTVVANAGTNLNTSALATSALQPTNAAQGSTTSGQTGHLVQCATTTASPTYTTAQTDPLSCDTAGNLRVNVVAGGAGGGAVTMVSGAVASGAYSSGSIASGAMVDLGSQADAACGTDNGTCSLIALLKRNNQDTAAAIAAGTNVVGYVSNDPCSQQTKSGASISLTASGQIITGTSAKKTYICSLDVDIGGTAQNVALVEGTGTVCATNIFGLAGGTTAATGWNLAANGGLTKGAGSGTVYSPSADTNGTAANVCLLLSSTVQTSGHITYVQQ